MNEREREREREPAINLLGQGFQTRPLSLSHSKGGHRYFNHKIIRGGEAERERERERPDIREKEEEVRGAIREFGEKPNFSVVGLPPHPPTPQITSGKLRPESFVRYSFGRSSRSSIHTIEQMGNLSLSPESGKSGGLSYWKAP